MMSNRAGHSSLWLVLVVCIYMTPAGLVASDRFLEIERKVDSAILYLLEEVPNSESLIKNAKGMLVIPVMTKVGFLLGGAYGEGAFRIGEKTIEYYSSSQANYGFQFGAQQYSHILFFMTDEAMNRFLTSDGFKFGVNAEASVLKESDFRGTDTISSKSDVIGVVFGQQGLMLGVSLNGTVYDEIE